MIDDPIVDSHVHILDPARFSYSWTAGAPPLDRRVLPEDFMAAAAPVAVDQFVFVEVDIDRPHHLAEAAWIADLARIDPRLKAMVASLPLENGEAVEGELEALEQHPILRAIRRLIQHEADPEFCIQPGFIAGLKLIGRHDLAFDICVYHHQLPSVIKMVGACPDMRFVLDHIGKPAIRDGLIDPWREHMRQLASFENVFCKISGVATEADHANWDREQLKPYITHAIEIFGFERVMFGGDWHVASLAITYPEWVSIVDWVTEGATPEEKRKLFRDTAIRFYRLDQ